MTDRKTERARLWAEYEHRIAEPGLSDEERDRLYREHDALEAPLWSGWPEGAAQRKIAERYAALAKKP